MKFLKLFCLGSLILLSFSSIQAGELPKSCKKGASKNTKASHHQSSNFGNAGFGVTDPSLWYTISTHSYPDSVPLSLNRNKGLSEGEVYLSPTGFTIGEEGSYWVNITAILQNPGTDSILIPVFLAQNETFNEESPEIGGVVTLAPNIITSVHGTGVIKNIEAGTRLSLVATNGGDPLPQDVNVVGWGISLFKLP